MTVIVAYAACVTLPVLRIRRAAPQRRRVLLRSTAGRERECWDLKATLPERFAGDSRAATGSPRLLDLVTMSACPPSDTLLLLPAPPGSSCPLSSSPLLSLRAAAHQDSAILKWTSSERLQNKGLAHAVSVHI